MTNITCTSGDSLNNPGKRGFDQERIAKLNTLEQYNYDRAVDEKTSENPLLVLLAKILSGIAWFFNSVFGYLVIALLIGLLVWVLIRNSERFFEKKKLPDMEKLVTVMPDEAQEKDYTQLIKGALKNQDYRMAIRYGFLSCLNFLHKKELIEWTIDKTNLDYHFELPEEYQDKFGRISMIYECIWYGDFSADRSMFDLVDGTFHALRTMSGNNESKTS